MINITKKEDCCGCSACAQRCPKQCITMQADNEGFLYPIVDTTSCIECGLCEKVCPVINQNEPRQPLKVYAAINKNEEIRMQSSSGGIFTLLAERTIKDGGVVFGVKFNKNWQAVFDYTETIEGIAPFRGSKYVQATVGEAYKQAEAFLKNGRKVLFSGTPCQIAGLKRFLRKEYDKLLTVDIICHGVPSPKVWDKYLEETCRRLLKNMPDGKNSVDSAKGGDIKSCIEAISFRSKITGWKKFSFLLKLNFSTCDEKNTVIEDVTLNPFLKAFNVNLFLRPTCYNCPTKCGKSNSNITIADFWGIQNVFPTFDDNKGTSLVLDFESKDTIETLTNIDLKKFENINIDNICKTYYKPSCYNGNRLLLFNSLKKGDIYSLLKRYTTPRFYQRILNAIKRKLQ